MTIIRFLYDNKLDSATLVESSQVSTLPAENLQAADRTKVWRTMTDTSEWVEVNFGSATEFESIALINHNFLDDVSLKMRLIWSASGCDFKYILGDCPATCKGFWDWAFKNGADRSTGETHLTAQGSVGTPTISWNADTDMAGFKCHFDSTDSQYWNRADDPDLDVGTGSFTLMGWVKTSETANAQKIMYKVEPGPVGWWWRIDATTGKQRLYVQSSSGTVEIVSNTQVSDGAWHHIAIVVERPANLAQFYLDGSPDSDWQDISAISTGTLSNADPFYLGTDRNTADCFNGYIGLMKLDKQKVLVPDLLLERKKPAAQTITYNSEIILGFFALDTKQYCRLEFDNSGNTYDYIEIGRIFVGKWLEKTKTFRDIRYREVDPSNIDYSEGSVKYVDTKTSYQTINLNIQVLSSAEYSYYKSFFDNVGTHKDFFVVLDYVNYPSRSYYVHFIDTPEFSSIVPGKEYYNVSMNMRESR